VTLNHSIEIRPARADDAEGISRVVIRALRETNAKDYAPHIIDRLVANFSPKRVASQIANGTEAGSGQPDPDLPSSPCP
jgi:hypothetical protein